MKTNKPPHACKPMMAVRLQAHVRDRVVAIAKANAISPSALLRIIISKEIGLLKRGDLKLNIPAEA